MALAIDLGSDTFPCASNAGIVARRVVVFDASTRGNVKLPAGTPEKTVAGVSKEKQSANAVAVQIAGVAAVESDGSAVINPGDWVIAVATTGQVKAQALTAGSSAIYAVVGKCVDQRQIPATAGEVVSVKLCDFMATSG